MIFARVKLQAIDYADEMFGYNFAGWWLLKHLPYMIVRLYLVAVLNPC